MRAASRTALANLRQRQAAATGKGISSAQLTAQAGDLYAVSDLLVDQPQLRRTLSDAATPADGRAGLVATLFTGKIGAPALELVQAAVRERWSTAWDLVDSLEHSADDTLFAAAERDNALDNVEDELFRFERILDAEPQLTTLLDEASVPAPRRLALLDNLVGAKVHPITKSLLDHALISQSNRGIADGVRGLLDEAAARRERSVARVTSAVELTVVQQDRLTAALGELYGRAISIRTDVDPAVRGGLIVRVGDEIIDGSVASRLNSVRAALAS
jgi:F-type H+-transporting ATPase subunit delta